MASFSGRQLALVDLLLSCLLASLIRQTSCSYEPMYGNQSRVSFSETESYRWFPDSSQITQPEYFISELNFDAISGGIVIGAADRLYHLDTELRLLRNLTWETDGSLLSMCTDTTGFACRNHIRVYKRIPEDQSRLLVCGTQAAERPQCRTADITGGTLRDFSTPVTASDGIVSYYPEFPGFGEFRATSNSDSTYFTAGFFDGSNGAGRHFSLSYQNITFSAPDTLQTTEQFRTITVNNNWLRFPVTFVDYYKADYPVVSPAMVPEDYQFYFVFLRENLFDDNSVDIIYSRVVRICRNDPGSDPDPMTGARHFTTYLKARIYCEREVPTGREFVGALNYQYNDIRSMVFNEDGRYHENGMWVKTMYGAFSGPEIGPTGSAVCAYRADNSFNTGLGGLNQGIFDIFRGDLQVGNSEEENTFVECDPAGRDAIDSQKVLIVRDVNQIGVNPLLVFEDFYIVQMALDRVCVVRSQSTTECVNQDVLFLGTDTGKVMKVVFASDGTGGIFPVIAEEITLEDNSAINRMNIKEFNSTKYLFVTTSSRVYRFPLQRCSRHTNCGECIQSRDPYCVWNSTGLSCEESTLSAIDDMIGTVPAGLNQNIHTGQVPSICDSVNTSEFGFCNHEITQTNTGNYTWEETEGNNTVMQGCALGPAQGIAVEDAVARRKCNMFGEWENPDTDNCITIVSRQFMDLQESITTITGENIEQITEDLRETVRGAREEVDQTQENLAVVVNVLVRTAAEVSERQTVVVVDEQTVNNIVEIVDDLMVWPEAVLEQNSSRIIQSFETIATSLVQQENFTDVTIIEEDVVFVAARVPEQRLQTSGASVTFSISVNATLNVDTDERVEDGLLPGQVAATILPATIFNQTRNLEDEAIGVFFSLYEESSLFPIADPPNNTRIGSPVVAATVAGRTFRGLPEPVIVLVRLNNITDGNITARKCVSWNFTLAGGRGNWTTEGCQTNETDDNDVVMCYCNHLTNFASLVDICTRTDGCVTPPVAELALDIISIIGVVLSLIGVVLTVITLLASKKLRERDVTKFHIQLCIALFCVLIVFVIGIDKTKPYGGCVTVSALIQYFILVAVMWMGAEAVLMFQKVVIVFVHISTRYIIVVSFICWLAPIVLVEIPLAIDRDYMLTFDMMTSSPQFCFIGNTGVFFGAFLGPIFAILVFNAVIFVIVVVVLLRHTMNRRGRTNEQMSTAKAIRLLISIMGVMVLFGLTWVFAALTISEASLVFQILFAAFNSLQGFFLFLFFCVFNEDAQNFWRQVFSCKCEPSLSQGTQEMET